MCDEPVTNCLGEAERCGVWVGVWVGPTQRPVGGLLLCSR